jgi:hypothetical protein
MYNLANYDILTNFIISDAICYTSMDQRDKDNEHENSDIAANALLMGEQRVTVKDKKEYLARASFVKKDDKEKMA